MDKDRLKLMITGILCFLISTSIMILLSTSGDVHYESYECVDGLGNKNLEGIMCEKELTVLFGSELSEGMSVVLMLLIIFPLMMSLLITGILILTWGDEE